MELNYNFFAVYFFRRRKPIFSITQLHNVSPQELAVLLEQILSEKLNDLKQQFIPKPSIELLTRHEVSKLFKVTDLDLYLINFY